MQNSLTFLSISLTHRGFLPRSMFMLTPDSEYLPEILLLKWQPSETTQMRVILFLFNLNHLRN